MINKKVIYMTQAQARERYPYVCMADGDYTRMLCTERNVDRVLRDWQSENPDAYCLDSECVLGRSYDATQDLDLVSGGTGNPIRITEDN